MYLKNNKSVLFSLLSFKCIIVILSLSHSHAQKLTCTHAHNTHIYFSRDTNTFCASLVYLKLHSSVTNQTKAIRDTRTACLLTKGTGWPALLPPSAKTWFIVGRQETVTRGEGGERSEETGRMQEMARREGEPAPGDRNRCQCVLIVLTFPFSATICLPAWFSGNATWATGWVEVMEM